MQNTTLANVPVGTTFTIWNRKFTVLDKAKDRVFVLSAELETSMPFRREDSKSDAPQNNFSESDIRDYLNINYLAALRNAGADTDHDLIPFDVDLKCTMGQHEYGSCTVKAGLLTLEQYGEYYDIIPLIDDYWWLATPWKTPSRSPSANVTSNVWYVSTDGSYGSSRYTSYPLGVRPALTLNPSLPVSWEDATHKEKNIVMLKNLNEAHDQNRIFYWCNALGEINSSGCNDQTKVFTPDALPPHARFLYDNCMQYGSAFPRYVINLDGRAAMAHVILFDTEIADNAIVQNNFPYYAGLIDLLRTTAAYTASLPLCYMLGQEFQGLEIFFGCETDPDGDELQLCLPLTDEAMREISDGKPGVACTDYISSWNALLEAIDEYPIYEKFEKIMQELYTPCKNAIEAKQVPVCRIGFINPENGLDDETEFDTGDKGEALLLYKHFCKENGWPVNEPMYIDIDEEI